MYWLTAKNAVVLVPSRWRSLSLLLSSPLRLHRHSFAFPSSTPPSLIRQCEQIRCFKERKLFIRATKKVKHLKNDLEGKDLTHVMWWKERMQMCRKPSSLLLVKRLTYTNLLGVDTNLKNGSLKEGTLNWEMLQFKSKFPREVLLCRVGDFYEAIGIDACVLVEYAGLNPFGGQRSDSIPKAGCPVVEVPFLTLAHENFCALRSLLLQKKDYLGTFLELVHCGNLMNFLERRNLRQTLEDLTRNGFSVCIVEEIQGPTQARARKNRFISGHAHPGSPYVFGLVADDHDLDFPEPMPIVGISRSAKGYCMISVVETMKTYSAEDGLTEEALVTKLRTCQCHHLFLHTSLKNNSSGTCRWGEFGEGGLLWGECNARSFEWFDGNPVDELLSKVKELFGLDDDAVFRNVTVVSENRPHPLHLGTATQIGAIPTEGIPCLLKVLLPSNCTGLPALYIRDLLLNPPAYDTARRIQETCKLMSNVSCSIPEFTCISSAKLVKLLELREANHIEFCKIKRVLDEILHMYGNSELNDILKLLMHPTWVATGLKVEFETLVEECELVSRRIGEIISLDGENDWKMSSYPNIPSDFFQDMESSWKGRIKRVHVEEVLAEVEKAAEALSLAVTEDFLPIISRIKATAAPLGGPKGEILYAREHEAVWFKGKRFAPVVWAGTPGEEQIKLLRPALDSKGKKIGEEWFTTMKVEEALSRYHDAGAKAKAKVLELLRELSAELQSKINVLVFASMLLVIAKALFSHASEGRRRKWVFPNLAHFDRIATSIDVPAARTALVMYAAILCRRNIVSELANYGASLDLGPVDGVDRMKITGLSPYWLDVAQGHAVQNTVDMHSLFLLTGPNGGGKSSLLRSICAAALLGICGFMVPAESAIIPHFDSIMLHMKSYDSPVDGKSSFQVEMSEIRSIIARATSRSLVLIDEICRGTETAKGTCIAGSVVETLEAIGCLGIVSTHLHGIFDLPLATKNVVCKAMSAEYVDGQTIPTWKLIDGICKESLAFETAQREGIPGSIIQRAEELYLSVYAKDSLLRRNDLSPKDLASEDNTNQSDEATYLENAEGRSAVSSPSKSFNKMEVLRKEVEKAVTIICQKNLSELYKKKHTSEFSVVNCVFIAARQQPPPSTIGASSVYVILRPDRKLYVGETDDLEGRVHAHRMKEGLQNASFLYFLVPGKSMACQLETLLINQLPNRGFQLTNVADGKHRNFGTSNLSLESAAMLR